MRASPIRAPPLRFLALALGGWICIRAAILAPGWWTESETRRPPATAAGPAISRAGVQDRFEVTAAATTALPAAYGAVMRKSSLIRELPYEGIASRAGSRAVLPSLWVAPAPGPGAPGPQPPAPVPATLLDPIQPLARPPADRADRRWSASAWTLLRGERGASSLAPAGTLGGSQAGARFLYRIGDGLALSGRAYLPLRRPQGAEAAAGLDWQPVATIPAGILAERRQALGREGRSAFSVMLHGGASRALPGGLRLDAYAQAGIVGLKSRDTFVDGSARVSAGLGPVEVGAGAWAAAQPGAARLDAGPALTYRLPVARSHLRLEADWRFRIAGDAAPGSGPALTLAADF